MNLPIRAEIKELHRKYAPTEEAFQLVFTHCCVVCDVAEQLMSQKDFGVDRELVVAGCLLHDLGVYRLYQDGKVDWSNYICHGVWGEELLREEGFPHHVCRFASHHTGVGITKQQIIEGGLPLPHEDFLAETPEEELIMYADKFHSKSEPPRFNAPQTYKTHISRFGEEHVVTFQEMIDRYGLPDLDLLSKQYGHIII